MRIEKLRLRGFIGIQRGLSLEEISLDFSGVSGLVAFAGQNGAGKSTVLENLHPHNQLASRDGALYRHCFLRDSEKELSFTYAGDHYRTLLKIDSDSGKSEGYIWKNGNSEVNGKISAYSEYIKNLLGSPSLFFASVFCAQNSKKISDMTTGQLKGLFAEFLRLDRLADYENTSKQRMNVLSGNTGQLDTRISGLNDRISGKLSLQNDLTICAAQAEDLERRSKQLKHQTFTIANRIDDLKEVAAQNAVNLQRKTNLQESIAQIREEITRAKQSSDQELDKLGTEYGELAATLRVLKETLSHKEEIESAAAKASDLTATIEGLTIELEKLTDESAAHQDLIREMETATRGIKDSIAALDHDEDLKGIKDEILETSQNIRQQEQAIQEIENDLNIIGLESHIASLEEKTSILNMKDPSCQSKTCAFIVNAIMAEEELPNLKKELAAEKVMQAEERAVAREKLDFLNERLRILSNKEDLRITRIAARKGELDGQIIDAEKAIKEERRLASGRQNRISDTKQQIIITREELSKRTDLAAKLPEVQVAEQRHDDIDIRMKELAGKGVMLRRDFEEKEYSSSQRIDDLESAINRISLSIDMAAEEKLKAAMEEKRSIEQVQIPEIERQWQGSRDNQSRIHGELIRIDRSEAELLAVQGEKESITREISEWTYLRNSCSKNGLQALEIDGAAPLITSFANDLLAQAFGPLFTVRLRTQDDEGREVLDIVVIMEDGSEILLDNLSGGQKIWVLMALRLAMTLLSKEKSGRNFETAFFDELDGPLDPENSLNFIGMYQAFMKTGGFKMVPFISHKPDCRSMADNVLQFEYGKNPVWG